MKIGNVDHSLKQALIEHQSSTFLLKNAKLHSVGNREGASVYVVLVKNYSQ